jgi:hypothetical protein
MTELPQMVDLTGFSDFLQELRNQGMQPVLMGDVPATIDMARIDRSLSRPQQAK